MGIIGVVSINIHIVQPVTIYFTAVTKHISQPPVAVFQRGDECPFGNVKIFHHCPVIAGYLYLDNGRMGGSNADDGKYQQQKQGHQQHVAIGIGFYCFNNRRHYTPPQSTALGHEKNNWKIFIFRGNYIRKFLQLIRVVRVRSNVPPFWYLF